jgi:para-aminobenzoate synthetase component 1
MIPVAFEPYRYREDAAPLFAAVRDLPAAIWLDGGAPGGASGRWDIITAAPLVLLQTQGELTTVTGLGENTRSTDPPLTLAQQVLDAMGGLEETPTPSPFVGGLAGFCGYDLGRCWNRPASTGTALAAPALTDVAGFPDMRLGWYAWALALDHQRGRAMLVFHPSCPTMLRRDIKRRLARPEPCRDEPFALREQFTPTIDRDAYLRQITRIQDYIRAGDCYQVNFAQHFSACFDGDPWHAYRQLRRALPSPHSAFMAWEQQAVLSFSPESLLHVRGGSVETRPIKGTRPRGTTPVEDSALADALRDSAKDRAENLMIVDLLRNDLGKTCVPGSVAVPELYRLASFANVHHLVSTVTGTMAPGVSALDVLAGCFPGGSITGAPKRRAMEIIDELEAVRRAVYCGSIGYISANGRMDMNIAIRTLAAAGDRLHCWGGGGIVADSVPAEEYRETLAKVSILMDSLATLKPRTSGGANL